MLEKMLGETLALAAIPHISLNAFSDNRVEDIVRREGP